MHEINYPKVTTYFIANTDDVYSWGQVDPDQCMTTGLKEIQIFTDEKEYLETLAKLGLGEYE